MTVGINHKRIGRSHSGIDLLFEATVQEAEQLLRTKFHVYKRASGTYAGSDEYSVPAAIQHHIDFITPTIHLDYKLHKVTTENGEAQSYQQHSRGKITTYLKRKSLVRRNDTDASPAGPSLINITSGCDQLVTPDCLRGLYNIPLSNTSHPENSFGIVQFGWYAFLLPAPLIRFHTKFTVNSGFKVHTSFWRP
jgi:tripeptidyl-peptidase-1